jgi:MGT family glycosyltransferase
MTVFLAYIEPVAGRLYPLVDTFTELIRRGHRVVVRSGPEQVEVLRELGIPAEPLADPVRTFEPLDWQARTRFGALFKGLGQFGERARYQVEDLQAAIRAERPDVLVLDETSWGAAAAAEASGLPWAFSVPSPVPIPSRDAPPFGLGLTPRHDLIGRMRDAIAAPLSTGTLARLIGHYANPLRRQLGLRPLHRLGDFYLAADLVLAFTAEPFEYPRTDWPAKVRLVGPGLWEPPTDPPDWLTDLGADPGRPLVLATCSTLFQNDLRLAGAVCEGMNGAPMDVVLTTGELDVTSLRVPANVRVEPYLPHSPILQRAACVVCHAGMGITQKALAHGVPVAAVPFGRDQPEVARRIEVSRSGVRLPLARLTGPGLRDAVDRAIDQQAGARVIATAFATAGGPSAAADALEALSGRVRSPQRPTPSQRDRG